MASSRRRNFCHPCANLTPRDLPQDMHVSFPRGDTYLSRSRNRSPPDPVLSYHILIPQRLRFQNLDLAGCTPGTETRGPLHFRLLNKVLGFWRCLTWDRYGSRCCGYERSFVVLDVIRHFLVLLDCERFL